MPKAFPREGRLPAGLWSQVTPDGHSLSGWRKPFWKSTTGAPPTRTGDEPEENQTKPPSTERIR